MSATRRTFLKAAALSTGMLAVGGLPAAADPAFDLAPVRALITRYIGAKACQFELRRLPPGGLDQFQISGERGHVVLSGTARMHWLRHSTGGRSTSPTRTFPGTTTS